MIGGRLRERRAIRALADVPAVADDPSARIPEPPEHLGSIVGGRVVHDDDLGGEVGGAREHIVEAPLQQMRPVERQDDDRDAHKRPASVSA